MTQGNYAHVNGLDMYYETHGGAGKPLVLLHGGFGAIEMFEHILPGLAETRQVIGVELQGHGHTADIARPLSFEQMADDVAALIKQLGLSQADLMGYSLGGMVALRTAIQHPNAVKRLVIVSAPFKRTGMYREILAGLDQQGLDAEAMKNTPMYESYAKIAPKPQDWSVLVAKMVQLMRKDYDWSKGIARMKMPVMIVMGDADNIRTAHAVEFFELLGGGQRDAGWDRSGMSNARLAILPGVTHYTIFSDPVLASTVTPFLDAPMPNAK